MKIGNRQEIAQRSMDRDMLTITKRDQKHYIGSEGHYKMKSSKWKRMGTWVERRIIDRPRSNRTLPQGIGELLPKVCGGRAKVY